MLLQARFMIGRKPIVHLCAQVLPGRCKADACFRETFRRHSERTQHHRGGKGCQVPMGERELERGCQMGVSLLETLLPAEGPEQPGVFASEEPTAWLK